MPARPWTLCRRAWLGLMIASLSSLALAGAACSQEPAIGPEFQLFLNAQEEIVRLCVYKPSRRDVMVGSLRGLNRQLGPKFAAFFPKQIPAEADDLTAVFIATLKTIAASDVARAAGFDLKYLVERSIDGYCRSLDAYSEYADEAISRRTIAARKPDYVGIGITIKRTPQGFFCGPFPGGPAALAGVIAGDELLEIDGANLRAMTLLEISARLSGLPATKVQLKVKHDDATSEALTITREPISSTPLTVEDLGGTVRIGFRRINERVCEDLRNLLRSLGPDRSLVLDFRGCPGGEFPAAVHVAELFLPEKTIIARIETVTGSEIKYSFNRAPYRPRTLRLLQDEFTASGAELIIAALLNHPLLKVESRGEKTFGKGVTVEQVGVVRGGVLKITDSRVYGPNDYYWDNEGLPPSSDAKPEDP